MVGAKHSRFIAALQLQDIKVLFHCFAQCKHDIDMFKIKKIAEMINNLDKQITNYRMAKL